jgi:hypothetical protein
MKKVLLIVMAVIAVWSAQTFAGVDDERRAAQTAQDLLDRAVRVGDATVVPRDALRSATLGRVVFVHHPVTLDRVQGIVPVLAPGGGLIGLIGVSPDGGAMQWCTFNPGHRRFPEVSREEAGRALNRRLQDLGRREIPEAPVLVQGADKHTYWRFRSGSDVWLVDAIEADAKILGSLDGSDVRALTSMHMPLPVEDTGLGAPPEIDALTAEIPPAYCLAGIPYHFQITDWYCGPASLQMIMDYLGEEIGQHNIADVADDVVGVGCISDDMRRSAHFSGMSTAIQDPGLQGYVERQLGYGCMERAFLTNIGARLKNTVYQGFPVFTLTWFSGLHSAGHYRVVKGYDDNLNVFVLHDPWYYSYPSGPDILIDQDFFVDDLWAYSGHWCMILSPWQIRQAAPGLVAEGDTFTVDVDVIYPAASAFTGQFTCTDCEVAIGLSAGLTLAGGNAIIALPDMSSGDTTSVSWDLIAQGPPGDWGMAFQARGILTASSSAYPSYTDSIGGHGYATVEIGGGLAAGWENEVRLTDGDASSQTCFPGARAMVVDEGGGVHIVWADTRDGNSEIYYRERVGDTWGAEVRLTVDSSYSHSPCIARDPAGDLHVAWVDGRDGNNEIYYKMWDSSGGWSADERVTTYGEVDCCPAIAAGDTAVYLAWERRLGGGFRVAAVYASVRGSSGWSVPVDVDNSPARDSYRPSLAYGPDDLLHLVYERQTSNDPNELERVVYKSWDGTAWSGRTGLSGETSFSRTPVIAAAADSSLHVVWQDGENTGGDIFYVRYDGSSWLAIEEIATGGTEAGTPSVAVDGTGCVHVAWVDHRHGDSEIYLVTDAGSGWGDEMRLTAADGASLLPSVAADAVGGVYVLWTDMRSGNADLYFRESPGQASVPEDGSDRLAGLHVELLAPHPVPFSSGVGFEILLAQPTGLSVEVFDILGRNIRQVASGRFASGRHAFAWDGKDDHGREAAPGVYFVRCASPYGRATARLVRLR